ncbi:hypothetical protein [Methyloraptor flagellatus]|uniref:Uncharacterized protein n=1 Tax=Methyloraptor flagellatus TaxID=3162530 RepID=A0AAU7XD12_9HYPH
MRSFNDRNEEAARFAAEVEAFGRDIAKARIAVADLRYHLAMRRSYRRRSCPVSWRETSRWTSEPG